MANDDDRKAPKTRLGTVPVVYVPSRERWQLTVWTDGKKKRTFHATEKAAVDKWKSHCRQLKRFGTDADQYSPEMHREYTEAKRLVDGADLRDVARVYLAHRPVRDEPLTVSEAVTEFLSAKEARKNLSTRHKSALDTHLTRFVVTFGERDVKEITGNQILSWLLSLGETLEPRGVWNYYGSLSNFCRWLERRQYVVGAPTEAIDESDMPIIPTKAKGVLTVDQSVAMMQWVDEHRPYFAAWYAIQLFAGIRNAEAYRIRWEWIDLERQIITLPGWAESEGAMTRIVKTGDDWALHGLPSNLWAWLRKYHQTEGTVRGPAQEAVNRMRKNHFPALEPAIPKWPANAMRHTFCTMAISLHGDAAKVATWSRHSSPRTLYKSYVAKLVSQREAERFFEITPR